MTDGHDQTQSAIKEMRETLAATRKRWTSASPRTHLCLPRACRAPLLYAAGGATARKHKHHSLSRPGKAHPVSPRDHSQLAALGKKHAADRTAQGRAYDAALARERTRYTDLEADYGRYQVTRDAEHHTHLAVSEQLKQAGKPPCSQSA